MKLAEFKALCQQEWNSCKGDIVDLWLTESSYRELSNDSLLAGAQDRLWLDISPGYETPSHASLGDFERTAVPGPHLTTVRNPVTKTEVRMHLSRDKDAADCYSPARNGWYTKVLSD